MGSQNRRPCCPTEACWPALLLGVVVQYSNRLRSECTSIATMQGAIVRALLRMRCNERRGGDGCHRFFPKLVVPSRIATLERDLAAMECTVLHCTALHVQVHRSSLFIAFYAWFAQDMSMYSINGSENCISICIYTTLDNVLGDDLFLLNSKLSILLNKTKAFLDSYLDSPQFTLDPCIGSHSV